MADVFLRKMLLHDDGLLAKAVMTFLIRALGAAASFWMNIAVARLLSVEEAGVYFLSLTLVMGVSVITTFGMDNSLMRFTSSAWGMGDYGQVYGLILQGVVIVSGIGICATWLLWMFADPIATYIFSEAKLANTIRLMALVIVPYGLLCVTVGVLKAIRLPVKAGFVEAGVVPMLAGGVLGFLLVMEYNASAQLAAIVFLVAILLGVFVGLVFMFFRLPNHFPPSYISFGRLIESAWSLMWVSALNYFVIWSPSLFLGVFSNAESVGLYNVAHRTAALISFILIVFNGIVAPRFASLHSEGKSAEIERLAIRISVLMSIITLPLVLMILFVPELILSVFGPEYSNASTLLIIISVGQFVNVITGSVGYLLIMTGNERSMRNNMLFTAILCLILNMTLVQSYADVGAALTAAICLAVQNFLGTWMVYRRLGICTIPGKWALRKMRLVRNST